MAPTLTVFGSFFPAWAACLIAGCVFAFVIHATLKATGLIAAVPSIAVFYLLTILLGANLSWLAVFA
jgi:hypothetical protein